MKEVYKVVSESRESLNFAFFRKHNGDMMLNNMLAKYPKLCQFQRFYHKDTIVEADETTIGQRRGKFYLSL
jgi:hypothetical protein